MVICHSFALSQRIEDVPNSYCNPGLMDATRVQECLAPVCPPLRYHKALTKASDRQNNKLGKDQEFAIQKEFFSISFDRICI